MDTGTFRSTLQALFSRPTRAGALMASGPPGCGKTSIIAQAAKAAGKPVVTLALPTCEAVDLRGMPVVVDGRTRWASPMPRDGEGVLILDEVSSAAPDVQVAAHHVVWAEEGSDMAVAPGWHIALTGNRAADKTLYRPLSGPLRNRLTLLNIEPDAVAWAKWAVSAGVDPIVIGFLRWLPDALTVKEVPAEGAFPSPRAWHRASDILALQGIGPDAERELLVGTVGEAAAVKLLAYVATARSLPSIDAIRKNMKGAPVPRDPSLCYAITSTLGQYTRVNGEGFMPYVARLPAEYGVLYITDVRDRYDIRADAAIVSWVSTHKRLFKDQ